MTSAAKPIPKAMIDCIEKGVTTRQLILVVVLDEPTAALDPIAENEIYSRFNSFVQSKTAIYISHRLSSYVFCDTIAVFDHARLVESGTHTALWNAQAKYYV